MAITLTKGAKVVSDESAGIQNATATSGVNGDSDDNDVLLSATSFPSIFSLFSAFGSVQNAALSGYTGAVGDTGLNAFDVGPGSGGAITDVGFVGPDGGPLAGLESGLLTLSGVKIFLYTGTNNNVVLGRVGNADGTANVSGAVAFAGYIEETLTSGAITGGKIWLAQYQTIKHPDASNPDDAVDLTGKVFVGVSQDANFSLAGAPSGQQLFLMFTAEGATADADGRIPGVSIIVTGKDPLDQSASSASITSADTVNSSQGGGNTTLGTNNQAITEQEGLRFTFVTGSKADTTIPNLSPGEAGVESNIDFIQYFGARSATFQVVQETGGTTAMVRLTASKTADNVNGSGSGVNFIDSYANDLTTEKVAINLASITVKTFAGATVNGVTVVDNGDGSVTIKGVPTDSQITYATATDHNRILIENAGSLTAKNGDKTHADFDIGGFKVLQTSVAKVEVGSNMVFEDDGPALGLVGAPPNNDVLQVDETNLALNASASFSALFQPTTSGGSDGANPVTSDFKVELGSPAGADSGLVDVATGAHVLLYLEAGQVVGRAGSDVGAIVFTVSVSALGLVTLDQQRALVHPNTGNPDDEVSVTVGLIKLTRTDSVTDKDGDPSSTYASIDIGQALSFKDDGPGVSANGAVQLDDDALANGNSGGSGDDVDATNTSGTLGHVFGADGAGTVAYLDTGAPSGFTYEKSGSDLLVKQGTTTVLTLTVNATTGAYTVTQNAAISHAAGNAENNQSFTISYRVTDKDGDHADGTLAVDVDDDTPTATGAAATGTVDEDGLANGIAGGSGDVGGEATTASGSVAGIFQSGADTPLSYGLSSNTSALQALSSGGTALVYSVSGNTLTAKAGAAGPNVFTFAITDTASGAYTFTLLKPLDHAAGGGENDITINLGTVVQATDKDGDTVTASAEKVAILVDDDTPTATGAAATGTVDEDGLANGIAGGSGDVGGEATTASGSVAGIFQSGADTPLSYGLSSNTSALQALSSGGTALVYSVSGNTLTAKAGAAGPNVFTFAITDTASGAYTFTLLKPLDHAAGGDENDITINLGTVVQATDKDGDTVTASAEKVAILVDDDTPTATGAAATGTVDEDGLANGIAGGSGDVGGEATTASGSVAGIFQSGADTPLSYGLSSNTSALQALSSGGTALVYSVSGNTLTAKAGAAGPNVFTFAITDTASGAYTFTLLKPLDHAAGGGENDITINLGTVVQATDKDGDTVTASAEKVAILVDDDTPTATGAAATGTVDEDGLANGIAGGSGDVGGEATTASGSVAGIFQSGADTPLSYGLSSNTSALQALSSGGTALVYSVSGNTLTAKAGAAGPNVFTFAITDTASGAYTFTLLKPLDHAAGGDENDITINLGTVVQATDKDGDTVTASAEKVAILVDDDTPTATGAAATGTVDEDGLANGIAGGSGDVGGEATTASGSVAGIFQSGADTPLSYGLSSNTSALQALSSGGTALVYSVSGNTLTAKAGAAGPNVFTFAITDTASGAYTFTLLKPLDHAAGGGENDITINLGTVVQATDKDGDTVTASAEKVAILVDDDTPTLAFGNLVGTSTSLPQIGFWSGAYGADGAGATELDIAKAGWQLGGVSQSLANFDFSEVAKVGAVFQFTGSLTGDFDGNGAVDASPLTFTLTADPTTGKYTLDLAAPVNSVTVTDTANGALGAGGPDAVQTLFIPPAPAIPKETVVFFSAKTSATTANIASLIGAETGATPNDPTEASLETAPLSPFIDFSRAMNVSTSGIGVSNNVLEGDDDAAIGGVGSTDESFVINPLSLVSTVRVFVDNSVSGYKYTPGPGSGGNERLYYTAYYADGTNSGLTLVTTDLNTNSAAPKYFDVSGGTKLIDAVQLTMAKGDVKIPNIQFITLTESLANDISLDFTASLTDKDGDTATSNFSADLFTNKAANATFDYELVGTAFAQDAFDVDLASTRNDYKISGFDTTLGARDKIVLIGDGGAVVGNPDNSGADSIVTITESGGQITTITVIGVDLTQADLVFG